MPVITGTPGADTLVGTTGDDTIDGGAGIDTLSYANATAGVSVSLGASGFGQVVGGGQGVDIILNIENLTGSPFNDGLSGDFGPNLLLGLGGDDTIGGLGGGDTLDGGAGDDHLEDASPPGTIDILIGGPGQDTLRAPSGHAMLVFAPGDSGVVQGHTDTILDWFGFSTTLAFGSGVTGGYIEGTAATYAAALSQANSLIGSGAAHFVAMAVGSDVFVFADSAGNGGVAEDAVRIVQIGLDTISAANLQGAVDAQPPPPPVFVSPPEPTLPPPVAFVHNSGAEGTITGNMDTAHIGDLVGEEIAVADPNGLFLTGPAGGLDLSGGNFTYTADDQLIDGIIVHLSYTNINAGARCTRNSSSPRGYQRPPSVAGR